MLRFPFLVLSAVLTPAMARGDGPPTFNAHVRPIFQAYCTECHGEMEKPKGGLDLRLRRLAVQGGKSGAAIVPGKPEDSFLLERVRDREMPPGKKKLSPKDVELLEKWVAAGARVETDEPATLAVGFPITADDRKYWAFRSIRRPPTPTFDDADRIRTPVDAFLAARLREKNLAFSPDADRATLIRRVTFDLIGLPPTPEDVDAFVRDPDSRAYEKLIDRLLASPRYGERWARHWLDVAGYADSEGGSPSDPIRTDAWKYRDYVIRAFNADKPIDQFIREQLAGDELSDRLDVTDPVAVERLIATGFLRMTPDGTGVAGADQKLARNQVLTDAVKVVASAFLGVTVGCAQCHNHRYDPVPQTDFYRLRAILEPAYDPANWKPPAARQVSLYTAADKAKAAAIESEAVKIDQERLNKQQVFIDTTFDKEVAKLPENLRDAARAARKTPEAKRNAEQKRLMREHPSLNVSAGSLYLYDSKAAAVLKELADKAAALRKQKPVEEFVRALTETPGKVPTTFLHHRGDPDQPKQAVAPGGLAVLDDVLPLQVPDRALANGSAGRRLALANWLTDPRHPLTARVIVNRVWMHHFGRGLVGTPGDFGRLGEQPTHPELLDWLAAEFIASGWKLKSLHRLILTSTANRQSSGSRAADPDNRLLGRYPVRRLDAETIRDATLWASGKLDHRLFGAPIPVKVNETGQFVVGIDNQDGAGRFTAEILLPPGDEFRRSLYVQVRRTRPLAVLDVFDSATAEPNCEARTSSTSTPQSLMLLNGQFVLAQAGAFAARVRTEAGPDARAQIARAWALAYGVKPTASECEAALAFLKDEVEAFRKRPPPKLSKEKSAKPAVAPTAEEQALAVFCQALLASNRFLYVD
jgi:hypothetical protein